MNRLTVFAHYDKDNLVDEYVWYLLDSLKEVSSSIVFVTTSEISQDDITRLEEMCARVIVRENVGYDFMSWQTGIKVIESIDDFDELVFCNDSVYGPIYPLGAIFDVMDKKDCDFWGMTDNYEIVYHLQSYFLVFSRKVVSSKAFKDFWDAVNVERTKEEVIKNYEVGLTQYLISAGFRPCAYAPCPSTVKVLTVKAASALRKPLQALSRISMGLKGGKLNYRALNPTIFLWRELLVKKRMPFLKVELLRDNPGGVDIKGWEDIIKELSDYDTELIRKHLQRITMGLQS